MIKVIRVIHSMQVLQVIHVMQLIKVLQVIQLMIVMQLKGYPWTIWGETLQTSAPEAAKFFCGWQRKLVNKNGFFYSLEMKRVIVY